MRDDEPAFAKAIREMREAIERRDAAEAERRGIPVEMLLAEREASVARDRRREIEAARETRLGSARRHIKAIDFEKVVSANDNALLRTTGWDVVSRWWNEGEAFLVLIGEKGCGKTMAACALLARHGGLFMPVHEVARAWRNEHDEAREDRRAALNVGLLVVDDLGFEADRKAALVGLQNLVDSRQGVGYRTIITTNLPRAARDGSESLESRYDGRTLDRIVHGGDFVTLRDPDLRRKVGA